MYTCTHVPVGVAEVVLQTPAQAREQVAVPVSDEFMIHVHVLVGAHAQRGDVLLCVCVCVCMCVCV
jgi:hypothetical protein